MARPLTVQEITKRISDYSRGRWTLLDPWKGGSKRDKETGKKIHITYRLNCSIHGHFQTRGQNLIDKSGGCEQCTSEFVSEFMAVRNSQWAREGRFLSRQGTNNLTQEEAERRVREKTDGRCELRDRWRGAYEKDPDKETGRNIPVIYNLHCSIHGEIRKDGPNLLNKRSGICKECSKEEGRKKLILTNKIIDQRLRDAKKRIVRLGDYEGALTKIWFLCTVHWEWRRSRPSDVLSNNGLMCCRIAQNQDRGRSSNERTRSEFDAKLQVKNPDLERVGEYINAKTPVLFKCRVHSTDKHPQIHPCLPKNALNGSGLRCCGADYANGYFDRVWRVLTGMSARKERSTKLYLFESPVQGINKFGITYNINNRAKAGRYGRELIKPYLFSDGDDAVMIEDAYKYGYAIDPPEELREWVGSSELTDADPDTFEDRINELASELLRMGRWRFAEEYCFPYHLQLSREILGIRPGEFPGDDLVSCEEQ